MSKEFNSDLAHFTNQSPAAELLQRRPQQQPKKEEERPRVSAEYYRETKSKKLQLLIFPSLYRGIKDLADAEGESVNNYINELLRLHLDAVKDSNKEISEDKKR